MGFISLQTIAVRPDLSFFRHYDWFLKYRAIFEGLFSIWQYFVPTVANF